jgi:tetratricopeptide (TPR) repeat protein
MKSRRLLLALSALALAVPAPIFCADTTPAKETVKPATPAEIAYWKKLQGEIAALRTANAAYQAKNFVELSVAQMNEIMSRLEKFLDAREGDPVDTLGADLQAYRKQLLAMMDNALVPLRLAAKGKGTAAGSANFNPAAAMENLIRANAQFRTVDGFKSELYRLHRAIDQRVMTAGGPHFLFFRSLNLGDSAEFEYAASTPAQRNEKFIAASKAIDPALGVLAEKRFIRYRNDGRLDEEIEAKRDDLLKTIDTLGKQMAEQTEAQLDEQIKGIPADFSPEERALLEAAVNFEKRGRVSPIGASIALQDWQAAFAQWLGKADGLTPPDGCSDLAVSAKEGWFAFTPDGHSVVARSAKTGAVMYTARTEGVIRGLAYSSNASLYAFTTAGLMRLDPPAGTEEGKFVAVNNVKSQTLLGRIAAAPERERFAYAWGAAPAIADKGQESLFKANFASCVTAVTIDAAGKRVVFGYSGQNDTGRSDPRSGFDMLDLPDSSDELAKLSITSHQYVSQFAIPITSIALSPASDYAVIAASLSSFGSVELYDLKKKEDAPDVRTQLALDNQPYNFVRFIGTGEALSVVAGARNGMVRVWSVKTGELTARFQVPAGAQGVALGWSGDALISVNLGAPGIYRWSVTDGKLLDTWDGDAPKLETEKLAAELKAEQARRPFTAKFLALRVIPDAKEKQAAAKKLLETEKDALDATGLRDSVESFLIEARGTEIYDLVKAKKWADALKLGKESVAEGLVNASIYDDMIIAARKAAPGEVTSLIATAVKLYPQSDRLRFQSAYQQQTDLSEAGRVDEAMKAVDEMDSMHPEDRPHHDARFYVLLRGAAFAMKSDNKKLAIEYYTKSLDHAETKSQQLDALRSIFPLAYGLQNWTLAVRAGSAAIELMPELKNDQQYMAALRYAYQLYQKQGGK